MKKKAIDNTITIRKRIFDSIDDDIEKDKAQL